MTMSIDNATPEEWDRSSKAAQFAVKCVEAGFSLRTLNEHLHRPFGDVALAEKCLAFALHQSGYEIECLGDTPDWVAAPNPSWWPNLMYRVRPKLEALVLPSIDWSHVAPRWKWLAQDKSGELWLYEAQPEVSVESGWWFVAGGKNTENHEAGEFASAKKGSGDWRKLIVQRPEGM